MFNEGGTEHHGKYFNMPLRNVLPKPLQKPHPPLWVACSQLDTLATCGEWGMGALGFQFVSPSSAHAWVHAYYNAFTKRQKRLADYKTNPNIALVSFFMCAPTDEEAFERADGATFFQFCLKYYGSSSGRRRGAPGTVNMWEEYKTWKAANKEGHAKALQAGLIGSPRTLRAKLKEFEATNIDQVVLLNQAGRNTHEHICESLELFAKEVMPEFHDAHPRLLAWKERVLNREIDLEEIDTNAFRERYVDVTMKLNIQPAPATNVVTA
jgi:alkanesulfonate monooxygenase SsuD/methylene tetrahydromethanopterin reductase-like flavin-dependent oxidoreductase (luciferase family)